MRPADRRPHLGTGQTAPGFSSIRVLQGRSTARTDSWTKVAVLQTAPVRIRGCHRCPSDWHHAEMSEEVDTLAMTCDLWTVAYCSTRLSTIPLRLSRLKESLVWLFRRDRRMRFNNSIYISSLLQRSVHTDDLISSVSGSRGINSTFRAVIVISRASCQLSNRSYLPTLPVSAGQRGNTGSQSGIELSRVSVDSASPQRRLMSGSLAANRTVASLPHWGSVMSVLATLVSSLTSFPSTNT